MKTANKLIIISILLPVVFVLACAGTVKADTTGSILINIDSNGSADPDCWIADGSCSVHWGDGADHGHSLTTNEFNNCIQQATKYATGLSDVSNFDITYQVAPKIVTCNQFDKGNTSYSTYRVSYAPKVSPITASCTATPNPIQTGQSAAFTASASGGSGSYTYSWSGACTGTSSSCSNTFSNAGTQTATVTVTSGTQTATANCSTVVSQVTPNLSVTCLANPSSIDINQSTTFTASASGGSGSYTYSWSGACVGSGLTCSRVFSNYGTQSATVTVTSSNQTVSANCSVGVNQVNTCTQNYQQRCSGNNLYWYDSCGNLGNLIQYCSSGCYNNACQNYSTSTVSVVKTVRNLSNGSGFSSSTYANPSDTLMFLITLQAVGNQDVQNVFVRDILPANLIYNNQLVVACTNTNNYNYNNNCSNSNYYNYSGNITSGINLNTIYAGQTITISYQAQVASLQNFAYGTTTLNNSVSVSSSNSTYNPVSNASVVVTRAAVLGASTVSTGLTNNFWVDSFILPLLVALIGIWMWRSGMFFGIEKWLDNKRKNRRGYKAEKELSHRIDRIQKIGR